MNKKNVKIAIIIPSRLASTRLPNKPLALIAGKTMIERVYDKACQSNIGEVFVACDSKEVAKIITKIGGKSILTDPNLPSGTDRIYAAYKKNDKDFDFIVNLQGDLPNIDPNAIKQVVEAAIACNKDITTIASKIKDRSEITNPNVVKIAIAFNEALYGKKCGKALYFSRAAIPYSKDNAADYYHHIGIYVYKKTALERFVALEPSFLEKQESLEQLRALENNMDIIVRIVNTHPLSVDTKEDLQNITQQILKNE